MLCYCMASLANGGTCTARRHMNGWLRTLCQSGLIALVLVALQSAALGDVGSAAGAESLIAFERFRGRAFPDMYVMNADGRSQRSLGPWMLFPVVARWDTDRCPSERWTYVVDIGDGAARRVTREERDSQPHWSPDGGEIVFERADAIHVVNADGTELKPLTTPRRTERDSAPVWSPGGRRIAWVRRSGPASMSASNSLS